MEFLNENQNWIMKFISSNKIGVRGAVRLGECISKLLNLANLDLNF